MNEQQTSKELYDEPALMDRGTISLHNRSQSSEFFASGIVVKGLRVG
jgi:hypothetical protein